MMFASGNRMTLYVYITGEALLTMARDVYAPRQHWKTMAKCVYTVHWKGKLMTTVKWG